MKSLSYTVAMLFIATAAVAQEGAAVVNVGDSINCAPSSQARYFPTVTLIQYQNPGKTDHFAALTITLTNGMINNYQVTGAPSVLRAESLAFTYSKVCITSVTQKPDGSLGSPVRVCYDVAKNIVS